MSNAYVGLNFNWNQSASSNSIIDNSSARHDYAFSGNRKCLILRDDFSTFSITCDGFQLSFILRLKCLFLLNFFNLCACLLFVFFINQLIFFLSLVYLLFSLLFFIFIIYLFSLFSLFSSFFAHNSPLARVGQKKLPKRSLVNCLFLCRSGIILARK